MLKVWGARLPLLMLLAYASVAVGAATAAPVLNNANFSSHTGSGNCIQFTGWCPGLVSLFCCLGTHEVCATVPADIVTTPNLTFDVQVCPATTSCVCEHAFMDVHQTICGFTAGDDYVLHFSTCNAPPIATITSPCASFASAKDAIVIQLFCCNPANGSGACPLVSYSVIYECVLGQKSLCDSESAGAIFCPTACDLKGIDCICIPFTAGATTMRLDFHEEASLAGCSGCSRSYTFSGQASIDPTFSIVSAGGAGGVPEVNAQAARGPLALVLAFLAAIAERRRRPGC